MKKNKAWNNNDEYGSDILGIGAAVGNLTGKVKTAPIGFVRQSPSAKCVPNKNHVSITGRSKEGKASSTQNHRKAT